jgi:hypothetical protein
LRAGQSFVGAGDNSGQICLCHFGRRSDKREFTHDIFDNLNFGFAR